ncbi:uncharacterized protein LOC114173767 [Vigna unguiculata]|uniref:uncharacterized protein LOC114173767 n=1 Tax=Vigna unguiculata TaxID=3917 RepID=UPI001016680D|nr:uncharacterized protein LOC114173767 [Vigna unguiculata]
MPHWFSYVGSLKLYQPLAGILRFVGLSLVSWYDRHGSGQLLRQASTAACMLNEIIFGISERASNDFASIFHNCAFHTSFWKMPKDKGVRSYLVECIGGILHEYLAAEFLMSTRWICLNTHGSSTDLIVLEFQDIFSQESKTA